MISRRIGLSPGSASLLAVLAVAMAVFTATDVLADDPAPTNLDLMTGLGNQVVEDIIGKINPPDVQGIRVRLIPGGTGEEYQLLDHVFTTILEQRGIETVHGAQGVGDSLYALDYKVPVFRLSYPKVYRSHLIGGKKVKREANLRVTAKLLSNTGDVVWIGESVAEASDRFSHGDLPRIQEGSYEFVQPEMPDSGWGKIVEPVLVSAIIVGMVYLFFSNQSDN